MSVRSEKVADRIKVVVAQTLETKVKDPRLGFVTITDVRVTGDLQNASIFYTVFGDHDQQAKTKAALESAKGLLRSAVGHDLKTRITPTLEFFSDALPEAAQQMESLLNEIKKHDDEIAHLAENAKPVVEDAYREPKPKKNVTSGFLVVDKQGGMTSHDVVAKARKELNTRKIGHAGTLDPMATGVLVLGVGDGTRLLKYITAGIKAYDATVKLGQLTSTDDKEGEVIESTQIPADIPAAFAKQVGKIMQKPSSVSAIRIDGKRAYDLVREGVEVDIPAREVEVYEIKINEIRGDEVDISVKCSAGTYIRAIARDCGGHLTALRRTQVGIFDLSMAGQLMSVVDVASKIFTPRQLDLQEAAEMKFGRNIQASGVAGIVAAITPQGELAALLEDKDGMAKPFTVFVK